ncbi:MAG: 2-octaprenyl-6-methoxyphenyl hydroxylase [Luteimonas sp.]
MTHSHDVLIVGAGLVGSSLAIALDRIGIAIGLVDAAAPGALPAVFDERNLSFADATVNALTALGVIAKLRQPGGPIRRIHVSRQGDFGRVVLDAADYGREAFGQVVVARDFGDALEARLSEAAHVTRYRGARLVGIEDAIADDARTIRIANDDGERTLSAALLVAADGTASALRTALGIAAAEHDYAQTLFVSRVRSERAPDGTAYERLSADGPTALLPRGDRHFGVVHAVARGDADAVAELDDAAYLARLQRAFGWRAGRFSSTGARSAYPARRVVAARTIAARAAVIGNAAQTLHPIGAQGFNLGLRDALTLAELIAAQRGDAGATALLDAYVARRTGDRRRTLAMTDGLARLTSNDSALLRPLRSLGLLALDGVASAQAPLVGSALGYRGDVPALCRASAGVSAR